MGAEMHDHSTMKPEGILVLKPHAPLSKGESDRLTAAVDAYLSDHARLHGVMIQSKLFPAWETFAGFTAHMRFGAEHHKKVERVALVTDSKVADIVESLGKYFISADVRHFPFGDETKALGWLETA